MQTIKIPLHTILFTVAPSNAGKSFFCKNVLFKKIKESYPDLNIQLMSSDDMRRELLGNDSIHKHDIEMMQSSEQAFNFMYNKLDNVLSFPIKAEIVIVDTTGLSEEFRNDMIKISKKHHYNLMPIVFDYDNREDYFSFKDEQTSSYVIAKHIKKLRKDVLKTLRKGTYKDSIRIKTKDFDSLGLTFEIGEYDFYKSHFLNDGDSYVEYCIISDVHGCYDELMEIIKKNECSVDDRGLIVGNKKFIIQDYVDKGYDILKTIEFVYNNTLSGSIIPLLSNHENYVYKRITGEIKETSEETKHFHTVALLEKEENKKYRDMFIELFEKHSKNFYRHKNFFVNHAPCESKFLGKVDQISLKSQRNIRYSRFDGTISVEDHFKKVEEDLWFVKKQAVSNSKPIVWGHVAIDHTKKFGNIYMIDTGCVSGNKLSSICFDNFGKSFIKTVSSAENEKIQKETVLSIFNEGRTEKEYSFESLLPEQRGRIHFLFENKVNFISGTVSPCNKDIENNILESLMDGLLYYKELGILKVILQPKYMGSRCNVYLHKDPEKTYCVTRNGYLLKKDRVDFSKALISLYENKFIKQSFANGAEIILLDAEILPWISLGRGLVEEQFLSVKTGINTELNLLKETGFEEQLDLLVKSEQFGEFKADTQILKKDEMIKKYGFRSYETFKNVLEYHPEHIELSQVEQFVNVYNRQMELFGSEGEVEFKPFSILKIVHSDGTEELFFDESNIEIFESISKDSYCVVDFGVDGWYKKAKEFYDDVTKNKEMEGIVIKPEKVYNKGVAPYMKCRNENYLSIVYGYDFKKENKYNKLVRRKGIKEKLRASIREFEMGKKMLEVPYSDIQKENKQLLSLYIQMVIDEENIQKLDPRL